MNKSCTRSSTEKEREGNLWWYFRSLNSLCNYKFVLNPIELASPLITYCKIRSYIKTYLLMVADYYNLMENLNVSRSNVRAINMISVLFVEIIFTHQPSVKIWANNKRNYQFWFHKNVPFAKLSRSILVDKHSIHVPSRSVLAAHRHCVIVSNIQSV